MHCSTFFKRQLSHARLYFCSHYKMGLFRLFKVDKEKHFLYQILPMTGFELQIVGIGTDRSANRATTATLYLSIFWPFDLRKCSLPLFIKLPIFCRRLQNLGQTSISEFCCAPIRALYLFLTFLSIFLFNLTSRLREKINRKRYNIEEKKDTLLKRKRNSIEKKKVLYRREKDTLLKSSTQREEIQTKNSIEEKWREQKWKKGQNKILY